MNSSIQHNMTLVFLVAMLASCVARSSGVPATMVTSDNPRPSLDTSADPADPLSSYLERSKISPKLFWQLKTWEALPAWLLSAEKLHGNWVESFHKNALYKDWPEPVKDAVARTMSGRDMPPASCTLGSKPTIMFSNLTPVYLREIQDIVTYPFVYPDSPDPNAKMLLDSERKQEAARRLALMLGMLEETSYLDRSDSEWNGGVRFGSHFIYYHEIGHIVLSQGAWRPIEIRPEEKDFEEEIRADQIAMGMLASELRNQQPDVIFAGFHGISVAMTFIAAKEFIKPYKPGLRHQTKGPVFRMARLKNSTRLNIEEGRLPPEALTGLQFYWDLFVELLREVKEVPSPVTNLLLQTADCPQEDWIKARNDIVKWCTFGDRESVIEAITNVYRSALEYASSDPRARRVIGVVDFLQRQTALLEPELGLSEALRISSTTLPNGGHH